MNRRITEIEHVLARTLSEDALRNLARPRPEFAADVASARRLPREAPTNKIDGGRIVGIEAMGAQLPYGTKSGWGD